MAKKNKQDQSSLDKLVEAINDSFGDYTIFKPMDNMPVHAIHRISTGNMMLDYDLGGGLAKSRIHLIVGTYSSGKTYLTNKVASLFTDRDERVVVVDPEHSYDPKWAAHCGMNPDLVHVCRGTDQESTIDLMELLTASGEFPLIILDSLAAMIPRKVKDEASDQVTMGIEAKLNNKMFKKLLSQMHELDQLNKPIPTILVVNQWREKVGIVFGKKKVLPHGRMQEYVASTIIDFSVKERITDKQDNTVGFYFNYDILKNKTAPPRRKGLVSMFVEDYKGMKKGDWDFHGSVIDAAVKIQLIEKLGKFYSGKLLSKKFMYKQLWDELTGNIQLTESFVEAIKDVTEMAE